MQSKHTKLTPLIRVQFILQLFTIFLQFKFNYEIIFSLLHCLLKLNRNSLCFMQWFLLYCDSNCVCEVRFNGFVDIFFSLVRWHFWRRARANSTKCQMQIHWTFSTHASNFVRFIVDAWLKSNDINWIVFVVEMNVNESKVLRLNFNSLYPKNYSFN